MKKQTISLFLIVIVLSFSLQAFGGAFTQGNLVVYRVGDGTSTYDLSKTGAAPIFLDEYSIETDGSLDLVQSIALPTVVDGANKRCVAVPSSVNMGYMKRSYNNRYIVVGGYDQVLGTSPWGAVASSVNRVVAFVDYNGAINTTTALTDAYSKKDIRSVYSDDGVNVWMAGDNDATANNGHLRYTTKGSTTSIKINALTSRVLNGYKNQLYVSGMERVYSVGTGFPIEAAANVDITDAPNSGTSANTNGYDFSFVDLDSENPGTKQVLYFTSATTGTIQKYSLISGVWTYNGDYALNITTSPRAMEVKVVADGVELYVICEGSNTATGSGKLYRFKDIGGYNNAFEQQGNAVKLLDFTTSSKVIRGITWAPFNDPSTSLNQFSKPDDFSVYSENDKIIVESLIEKPVEVYSVVGAKLFSGQVRPGTPTELSQLQKGQVYMVKVGDQVRKVIF